MADGSVLFISSTIDSQCASHAATAGPEIVAKRETDRVGPAAPKSKGPRRRIDNPGETP